MLSRLSLDNHHNTHQSILNNLTSDISSAASFCFYPTAQLPDLINILVWLGRLPRFRSSLEAITSSASPGVSLFCDVVLPHIYQKQSSYKDMLSAQNTANLKTCISMSQLVNYLIFLRQGDYRRLCDRIFDTCYKSSTQPLSPCASPDLPDYYFIYEKHLIRSLCQFLHTTFPLVRRSRLYKKLTRYRQVDQSGACCECSQPAVNIVWTGCGHLHCHCCLSSHCAACDTPVNLQTVYYP